VFIHHSDLKKMAGDVQEPIEEKKRLLIHDATYETRSTKYFAELKDATLLDQVKSPEFLRLLAFFLVNSFCVNFYIGSFNLQLGDGISFRTPLERQDFARLFTLIITLGVIFIPIVGTIMDKYGFPMASSSTTIFGILWIIFLLVRTKASLLVSFCCYALFRTFFFTFVFAYLADTLGFKYFGVLAGIMFVLGGFLSFLQVPLAKLVSGDCHLLLSGPRSMPYCQPGHWQSLNILFGLMIAGTLYFSYKDWINREEQKAFRQQQQSSPSKQPGQPSSSSLQMVNQKKNPLHQQQTYFSNLKNYGAIHEDREEEEQ
jgi:MFS family permease